MLSGYLVKGDNGYAVGATDTKTGYTGPSARVYRDDNWLFVNTDDYEGQAMLNWETLPFLIEALQKLQKDHENVA